MLICRAFGFRDNIRRSIEVTRRDDKTHRSMAQPLAASTGRQLSSLCTVRLIIRPASKTEASNPITHKLPSRNCLNSNATKHLPSPNSACTPNNHSPFFTNIPKIHISSKTSLAPSALKYSTCLPSASRIARCELSL